MEETDELFPSHCLLGQAGKSLYPVYWYGLLYIGVDLLTPVVETELAQPKCRGSVLRQKLPFT